MRIPSSAKTAPFAGCINANSGQISLVRSITSGSLVNARGSTSMRASMISANTPPAATASSIMRRAAR